MYRPQFAYATPDGYQDQDFSYSFDGKSNTPLLAGTISPGVFIQNIVLPLQPDEVFIWRGTKVISYALSVQTLYIQFKDPMGNYLSPAPVPISHIVLPSGVANWGNSTVPMEPEIPCPAGSNITVYIQNPSAGNTELLPRIVLYGIKRGPLIEK